MPSSKRTVTHGFTAVCYGRLPHCAAFRILLHLVAFWVWTLSSACALVDATRQPDGQDDEGTGCEETQSCDDDPGDQGDDASDDDASAALTAIAGPSQTVDLAVVVVLDGSATNAAGAVTYTWTLSAPAGSAATLSAVDSAATSFTTDREGVYTATLVVSDGQETSAPDSVTITARDPATTGLAGPNKDTYTGTSVTLEGSAGESGGGRVTYAWRILSAPAGSAAVLDDPTAPAPVLVPDQDGPYFLLLVVSRDGVEEPPDVARVMSYHPLAALEHRVVDAEYSRGLARIIMVSENPNRLYVHDPENGTETSVGLPSPPTSISVSPDGTHAAVGHDGSVSHVSLTEPTRLATRAIKANILDVVLDGNGRACVTIRDDIGVDDDLRCMDLSNGVVTVSSGGFFKATDAFMKLHPSRTLIYAAENGVIPEDIGVYDISSGTAVFLRDSPYHGDHAMCGNLWMSDDGLRIFTRCGRVFRYSDLPENDMVYNGSLADTGDIRHLDHSSVASKIVVLPDDNIYGDDPTVNRSLRIYGHPLLLFERRIDLTRYLLPTMAHPTYGRFAFISVDGTKVFVVVQVDEESALLNDYAVVTYDLD